MNSQETNLYNAYKQAKVTNSPSIPNKQYIANKANDYYAQIKGSPQVNKPSYENNLYGKR